MYFRFALRYFKGKNAANAVNIIAWLTILIIATATFCQVIVLSVFNGFEGLVKSLYSSFYSDIRVIPAEGKTFTLTPAQISALKKQSYTNAVSMTAEGKAVLQNDEQQTIITLKGADENFQKVSGVPFHITLGHFETGTVDSPKIVVGFGVQNAASINISEAFPPSEPTVILAKKTTGSDADAMSEGILKASGVFAIQQEIDNQYAVTNIGFVKQQMNFAEDEYSAAEIKLKPGTDEKEAKASLENILGKSFTVQTRYEQNATLYKTMRMEKWAIFGIFTLIIIISSFTMVSSLTMLVLEKRKDISILQSMGTTKAGIQKIFLLEGLLLGGFGAAAGILLALIVCFLQMKFHFIKISGGSFLIDYFPVKIAPADLLIIAASVIIVAFIAAWFPARKAAKQKIELKS